jgi:hypothetical protein
VARFAQDTDQHLAEIAAQLPTGEAWEAIRVMNQAASELGMAFRPGQDRGDVL